MKVEHSSGKAAAPGSLTAGMTSSGPAGVTSVNTRTSDDNNLDKSNTNIVKDAHTTTVDLSSVFEPQSDQ